MKTTILFLLIILSTGFTFAQKETFDLVSYTPVKGWKKEQTDKSISFSNIEQQKNTFCVISIYKSLEGGADSKNNFDNSWQKIVQEPLGAGNPKMEAPGNENGWNLQTGSAKFSKDGLEGIAILVTASSGNKMMNLLVLLNSDKYMPQVNGFISSIELKQTDKSVNDGVSQTFASKSNSSVTGLWTNYILETTGYSINGMPQYTAGYLRKEYNFYPDGTYLFRNKQWLTKANNIVFIYEKGTYSVNGNQITITPKNGKSGFWTKTSSSKEWGKLVKYSDYKLEKTTYNFEIIEDPTYGNSIVLKPGKPTLRDGGQFNAANDPYEFRYSYRTLETSIDNPPGFRIN